MNEEDASDNKPMSAINESRSQGVLEADIRTVQEAFKTALLQLGLLSRFQRDVRTLGIQDYASKPPSQITNALLQALKAYNEACNNMEAQIMRARAVLSHKPDIDDPSSTDIHVQAESVKESPREFVHQSMTAPPEGEHRPPADSSEDMTTVEAPQDGAQPSSLLNDAEMEDLFGPATVKTDASMISTPASTIPQPVQPDPSRVALDDVENIPASEYLNTSTSDPSGQTQGISETQAAAVGDPAGQLLDPTTSMFDFGSTDMNVAATAPALPDTNFDFSHMTSEDFNSLLASLGASSGGEGGQGESGNAPLQGLDLGTDLSNFLNTDLYPNP